MKLRSPLAFLLLAPIATAWTAIAQEPAGDRGGQQPIRVEVDAVNLLVTVNRKKTNEFVKGLTRGDFEIYEDGTLQEITNFASETDLPLTIALCIDTSSSVRIKLDFEKEVAADFIYTVMRPTDRALLLEFDTGVTLLHDFTHNPNDLVREIEQLRAGGGTSLYDAIYLISDQKMIWEDGRKTIVLLSDGADQTSTHTFEEALRLAYRAEASIFAISTTRLGADIDHEGDNALRQLTRNTGGNTYFPVSTRELTTAFQEINDTLRNQYSLTYSPINKKRDGTFRKLRVKVHGVDDVVIRHRNGYYAEPADPAGR